MADTPQGVIAMFIDDHGRVIASVSDFERGGAAGFTNFEQQQIRARDRLKMAVVNAYASPQFARGITSYEAGNILRNLEGEHGCRVHIEAIGHEEVE